ncbi:MAG: TolC family protein [Rikenellaceae bacterium]|nr:TolC family protein [Rikenellaceae bacterium]
MNRKIYITLGAVLLLGFSALAQEPVTLQQCIAVALKDNYSVIISSNELEISKNNVNLAPFLPSLTLGSKQTTTELNERSYNQQGAISGEISKTTTILSSATLNWRLFDGFSMFAERDKQVELLRKGEYAFRSVVENLVMNVSVQYYKIISLQNQVKLLDELLGISDIRYNQALTRYRIGKDSGLEYKQAKINLNSDSSQLLLQRETLKNAYIELFRLMNVPTGSKYIIKDTILPEPVMSLDYLLGKGMENNTSVLAAKIGERVAGLDLKIAKSSRYPVLDLSAGYNYNLYDNDYFPSKFDRYNGYNFGLNLSIPIFDGLEANRKIKNAKILRENARLNLERERQDLDSQLRSLYNLYINNIRMVEFERENKETAYFNLEAAMEKYKLGGLSGIEFRDIQLSYLDASDRMLEAVYQAKISEITLHLLIGDLFQTSHQK